MTHYKFVSWDVPAFETILTGRIPAALLAADNGNLQPLKIYTFQHKPRFINVPVGVFLLRNICAALLKCTH